MTHQLPPLPEPWPALMYSQTTGAFVWARARGCARKGAAAGTQLGDYWGIRIGGRTYLAHRVAVLFMTGEWPASGLTVDHIDGNKLNNAWVNLRVVSQTINNQNLLRGRNGSRSGLIGAHWNSSDKKWQSAIKVNGLQIHLGKFSSAEEAHACYIKAKREMHSGCTI